MQEWRASREPLLKPKDRKATSPKNEVAKYAKEHKAKTWLQVWVWLKPRLEKAGRTKCEFVGILEHKCSKILDPVHSKKRRKCSERDLYAVAIGCRNAHDLVEGMKVYKPLDRRITQVEMERFVLTAINLHGGLILPTQ